MKLYFKNANIDTRDWLDATRAFGVGAVGQEVVEVQIAFSFLDDEKNGIDEVMKLAEAAGLVFVRKTDEVSVKKNQLVSPVAPAKVDDAQPAAVIP